MKLTITIEMDNAAFGEDDGSLTFEAARILTSLASELDAWDFANPLPLRDVNGNTVGKAKVSR